MPHHAPIPAHHAVSAPQTITLYDGKRNTTPQAQNWMFYATGGSQTPPHGGGATTFSTLGDGAWQGGYARVVPFALDRRRGYTVTFDLQVLSESHAVPNRAGVALIVTGDDRRGLELDFWTGQVWAQSDTPLFRHAEGVPFPTTRGVVHYALTVQGLSYNLSADGVHILSGPVRNYTAFHGVPDPYQVPNLLFLGDDTHSAAGSFRLARVGVRRGR